MLALKVKFNDEPPITGGTEDLGVISAIVTGSGPLGSEAQVENAGDIPNFHLRLGGLTARGNGAIEEHLEWLNHHDLRVGDRILIEVVETQNPNGVISRHASEAKTEDEKYFYERTKELYFELKAKYEPE